MYVALGRPIQKNSDRMMSFGVMIDADEDVADVEHVAINNRNTLVK